MKTKPARLAKIPVEIFQTMMFGGWPSKWTKRETGQWVTHGSWCALLPISVQKMAALGCPFHEVRDKSQFGRASQPSSCDQAFTVSCIVMQFTHESFGICHFCGSWLNRINPRVLKITNAVCTWRGWTLPPFTLWMWKNTTCLWDHFAQYDFKKSPPFWKSAMKLWIIQCLPLLSHAPSQNFVWHLLWLLITEGKLFNSLFHSAYLVFLINLISIKPICLPCIICGTYAMRINAVLWHVTQQTF